MCKRTKESVQRDQGLSRRELIKAGGKGMLGMAFVPAIFELLKEQKAFGANTPVPLAHITITQRAGDSFGTEFVALSTAGNQLSAGLYSNFGADGSTLSTVSTAFGAPMFQPSTGVNIPAMLTAAGLAGKGLQFATFAHQSNDDVGDYVYNDQLVVSHMNMVNSLSFKLVASNLSGGSDLSAIGGYSPITVSASHLIKVSSIPLARCRKTHTA